MPYIGTAALCTRAGYTAPVGGVVHFQSFTAVDNAAENTSAHASLCNMCKYFPGVQTQKWGCYIGRHKHFLF